MKQLQDTSLIFKHLSVNYQYWRQGIKKVKGLVKTVKKKQFTTNFIKLKMGLFVNKTKSREQKTTQYNWYIHAF